MRTVQEHRQKRKARTGRHPTATQDSGLVTGSPAASHSRLRLLQFLSELGYYSLVQTEGAGTWWQDMFQQGLLKTERGQGQVWAVSVGDRGLQLLQAAPAEFCSVWLPIFS